MSIPAGDHICRVCLTGLDWNDTEQKWIHGLAPTRFVPGVAGHEPEPVVAGAFPEHRYFCDFCFAAHPTWRYPCASFEFVKVGGSASHEDWAACDACHAIIETGDRSKLVYRVVRAPTFKDEPRAELELILHELFRKFFGARTGPGLEMR